MELPGEISEGDALLLENLTLKKDLFDAQKKLLEADYQKLAKLVADNDTEGERVGAAMREKYGIKEGDGIDMETRKITRAK